MCYCNSPCFKESPPVGHRKLSLLLLDCWQREYDKRPYSNFEFHRLEFEQRLDRAYDPDIDFATITMFIRKLSISSVKLVGLRIESFKMDQLYNFVESLKNLRYIELKLMNLPTEFFQLLEEYVESMSLTYLSLEGTPLNNNDIISLRSFVSKSNTLQTLNVASCNINQYNFADLADGIHKSKSIVSINVSRLLGDHLTLDSEKITHIISNLIWQNKLQKIDLEKCELIAQDMEIIAEYLFSECSKLQKLNVAFNKIGPDGAHHLLKAISTSKTLKHLNLSGCGLGTHGGEIVSKFLSLCFQLESLNLQYNNMAAETVNMILLCIKQPNKLNKLYLYGNKYNPRTGEILRRVLDARVVLQNNIDITATYDDTLPGYRVIPWLP